MVFSSAFYASLNRSCSWWLQQNTSHLLHPTLTENQQKQWLAFCHAVVQSPNISQDLPSLITTYLERIDHQENAFFTGYYEPTLKGSFQQSDIYPTPLYRMPPCFEDQKKRPTRKNIRDGALLEHNLELVYVNDSIDAFFLEIQGSGRIELDNGDLLRVGYAGQNGHPFTPIGRLLKERGALLPDAISLQTIKQWLRDHPHEAHTVMDHNESYVFFKEILGGDSMSGPIGTQQLPLTPLHSLACDGSYWPFGMLVVYELNHPLSGGTFTHMALTQDTGGAIKGHLRFDLFCGHGEPAENLAGHLKHFGKISSYLPKNNPL